MNETKSERGQKGKRDNDKYMAPVRAKGYFCLVAKKEKKIRSSLSSFWM